MLTAYEQYAAQTFDEAGIDVLLVGDSASNNVFGNETSLPVTVDELIPLTRAVARSVKRAMVVGDLPFGSYQASPEQGYLTAVRFMKEAGRPRREARGRRRDGAAGPRSAPQGGIPVMAHIGFTPQSEHTLGGYRVQGRGDAARPGDRRRPRRQEAGAFAVVMEMVPGDVAGAGHQGARPSRRSASAPAPAATARSSSGRTPSACAPAGWRASSSSTPTCTACCSRRPGRTPTTSVAAPSRAPTTRSDASRTAGVGTHTYGPVTTSAPRGRIRHPDDARRPP